ncbi:GL25616 [Drosophila persimilis]|uniref:GL25616 n=1 Tax=Drosophila persimilis TaxID=7234 RepID=B4GUB7_DROPE|nr:uncharacterized protein LOC6597071 [Drosophila persimilis]EDW26200.1 GL25616 [Drosophila persimilis]
MSSNTTLYYSAVEDMFKELLTIEVEQLDTKNVEESDYEPLVNTPRRCVPRRQHNLFAKDSTSFVICRRSPKIESCFELGTGSELSSSRRRELQANQVLRLRIERTEKELKPQRRLSIRI